MSEGFCPGAATRPFEPCVAFCQFCLGWGGRPGPLSEKPHPATSVFSSVLRMQRQLEMKSVWKVLRHPPTSLHSHQPTSQSRAAERHPAARQTRTASQLRNEEQSCMTEEKSDIKCRPSDSKHWPWAFGCCAVACRIEGLLCNNTSTS